MERNNSVQDFLDRFLSSPSKQSPQAIRTRFKHWAEVYAHPEKFTEDHSPHSLAAKRKSARQCLHRLAVRHPDIAETLLEEKPEVTL